MTTGLTRRGFVLFGAAAIGNVAATSAFAARVLHPQSQSTKPAAHAVQKGGSHVAIHRGGVQKAVIRHPGSAKFPQPPSGGFPEPATPAPLVPAQPGARERFVRLVNAHTGEAVEAVYWREGSYLTDPMHQVARVLRDHMSGDMHAIDPRLIDLLGDLRQSVGSSEPFQVISGYRSPRTNAWMHRHQRGVAAHSLHMRGQAADIVLADSDLGSLHNAALELGEGGVGYYPRSGFVHVDTGAVREWMYE
jgi:uncharacterized protein YcbK (DUF882 family)